jgi:hypothetical protein
MPPARKICAGAHFVTKCTGKDAVGIGTRILGAEPEEFIYAFHGMVCLKSFGTEKIRQFQPLALYERGCRGETKSIYITNPKDREVF